MGFEPYGELGWMFERFLRYISPNRAISCDVLDRVARVFLGTTLGLLCHVA